MTNEKAYRLGEYRITVYDDVLVRWERHAPLGNAQTGRCFLWDNVLIIGKQTREEDGFLIGEFHDKLRKLPPWTKTRYYCFAGELFNTAIGQPLTDEMLEQGSRLSRVEIRSSGARRLGNFQITVNADNDVSWRTSGAMNRIACGPCSFESGILVIGLEEKAEPGAVKREFIDTLSSLQPWDLTIAWCRSSVLRMCSDLERSENGIIAGFRKKFRPDSAFNDSPQPAQKRPEPRPEPACKPPGMLDYGEIAHSFLLSGWKSIKKIWRQIRAGDFRLKVKWLKWIMALLVIIVLLGLAASYYIIEEGFHWSDGFKKHHHKHHEH